jgi:uncharacterized membrane protein
MTNRWFLASLALFVAAAGLTAWVWGGREWLLPDPVPVHWGFSGQPDQFVPRESALPWLLIMPGTLLGLVLLGRALPWLSPRQWSIDTFRETYEQIMFIVAALMTYLGVVVLLAQMGHVTDVGRWLMAGLVLLIGALGNLMGKVRRNLYVGIRTPWTLASDMVWERTHRLGAWLMVGGAAAGVVLLFLPLNPLWSLAGVLLPMLATIPYSLWLYKKLEAEGKLETQREGQLSA